MNFKPPFTVTDKTVNLVADISEFIGKIHIGIEETLPEKVKKLMQVISYVPKSAKELMAELGLTRGQTLRNSYLKPAMEKGLITMTEPEKPNSRNQKYYKK